MMEGGSCPSVRRVTGVTQKKGRLSIILTEVELSERELWSIVDFLLIDWKKGGEGRREAFLLWEKLGGGEFVEFKKKD